MRTLQIIVVGLVLGVTTFLLFVLFKPRDAAAANPNPQGQPIIFCVTLAMAVSALIARAVIPRMADKAARQKIAREMATDASDLPDRPGCGIALLLGAYQTRTIVSAALLEGPTFALLISYMIEGFWPALVIAVAFICGIAAHIPTVARVSAWLELQSRLIRDDRGLT
ncbi:MAG: hypothetical protein K8T25_23400 [Planctomycetia bacterium]|nr:hypothetical protein [Planctomycetia bacterium]